MRFNTRHSAEVGSRNLDRLLRSSSSRRETKINPRIIRELFRGPLRLIEPVVLARTWIAKNAWTVERRNNFRSHVARFRTSLSLPLGYFFPGGDHSHSSFLFFPGPEVVIFSFDSFFSLLLGIRFPLLGSWKERAKDTHAPIPSFPFATVSNRVWLNRV